MWLHKFLKKFPHWILSIVCLTVILWLTLVPDPLGETDVPWFEGADKLVHGIMFFGLALCLLLDTKRAQDWKMMSLAQIGGLTLLSMLIGIGIECVQPLFGRGFEFWDMGADAFGAVLAGTLWTVVDGAFTIDDKLKKHE